MLDPARSWVYLGNFLLRLGEAGTVLVIDYGAGTRCSLIDREKFHPQLSPPLIGLDQIAEPFAISTVAVDILTIDINQTIALAPASRNDAADQLTAAG